MSSGLRNAPATFQQLMHLVLTEVEICEVYLGDAVAYTATWSQHLKTQRKIF